MNKGVNFFGPYEAQDSIGRVAALNIACLEAGCVPHDVHLLSRPAVKQVINYATIDDQLISSLTYRINLFHFNARRVPLYFSRLGEDSLKGYYNIGFWVHEMQTFPNQWARQLEFFDEIWTPSSLCQSAISLSAKIPVLKIPYPIESNPLSPRIVAKMSGEKFREFNFLAVFDVNSDAERKNPLFTVKSFLNAHKNNKSVRLILKIRNLELDKELAGKLRNIVAISPNIEVISGYMEQTELSALYDRADVYVSLHRAEGFGLTISDAMSRGIPVLVTGYSGNMDFCNAADTRVVSYQLREVGHNRPRYRCTDLWAEPDMADAEQGFIDLVENDFFWMRKALKARQRIENEFSVERIGKMMQARIELIEKNFTFPDDMSDRQIDFEVGLCSTYGL